MLVVGVFIFSLGWLGGGDVKLLAALALWAGPDYLVLLLLITGISGGVLAIAYILSAFVAKNPTVSGAVDWMFTHVLRRPAPMLIASNSQGIELPYGVAIAVAGFAVFYKISGGI